MGFPMRSIEKTRRARAIAPHSPKYATPLTVEMGEALTIEKTDAEWQSWRWCVNRSGKGGWIPDAYLEQFGHSGQAIAREDYTAKELTVEPDERLTLHYEESGWFWASRQSGEEGWVPAKCVVVE